MCNHVLEDATTKKRLVAFVYPRGGGIVIQFAKSTRHKTLGEVSISLDDGWLYVSFSGGEDDVVVFPLSDESGLQTVCV